MGRMFSFNSKKSDRRLPLSPTSPSDQTSFRIGGSVDGEVDLLCRSLGLSGPQDFEIPAAVWEASFKSRANSSVSVASSSPARSALARPPLMKLPAMDGVGSTWDLVRSFAPAEENEGGFARGDLGSEEEEKGRVDDELSGGMESTFSVSPNGRVKRIIGSWMRGQFLGSGSFGMVYEGISK